MWSLVDIVALSRTGKVSNSDRIELIESTSSFAEACEHLGIVELDQLDHAEKIIEESTNANTHVISYWNERYPASLRSLEQPPVVLYVRGTLPSDDARSIAVVGTRSCTVHYGKPATEKCVSEWTNAGCVIVSGLANGIDTIAHETSLQHNGITVAVVASGLGKITPIKADGLALHIADNNGAVVSEHPHHVKALPPYFPARNRIISAMSSSVVVVESKAKGGGLITADFAQKMNRKLWALPGPITSTASAGTNALIADGKATMLREPDDVLREHGWTIPEKAPHQYASAEQRKELEFFESDPKTVDEIAAHWKCAVPAALERLFDLELLGVVQQLPGRRYVVM